MDLNNGSGNTHATVFVAEGGLYVHWLNASGGQDKDFNELNSQDQKVVLTNLKARHLNDKVRLIVNGLDKAVA